MPIRKNSHSRISCEILSRAILTSGVAAAPVFGGRRGPNFIYAALVRHRLRRRAGRVNAASRELLKSCASGRYQREHRLAASGRSALPPSAAFSSRIICRGAARRRLLPVHYDQVKPFNTLVDQRKPLQRTAFGTDARPGATFCNFMYLRRAKKDRPRNDAARSGGADKFGRRIRNEDRIRHAPGVALET